MTGVFVEQLLALPGSALLIADPSQCSFTNRKSTQSGNLLSFYLAKSELGRFTLGVFTLGISTQVILPIWVYPGKFTLNNPP